jgi:hypothetical protein
LHQAGDISIIFQHKNRLTQIRNPRARNNITDRLAQAADKFANVR